MTLRLIRFLNLGVNELQAEFSSDLDTRISISNVLITSNSPNIDNLTVLAVTISGAVITVTTTPQYPSALYNIAFVSTSQQLFASINGDTLQDDIFSNSVQFVGMENTNDVRTTLLDSMSPIYNIESDTLIRKHISNISREIFTARSAVREIGNNNYVSIDVIDELHTRGFGPTDRLNNEGVYKITRVGTTLTGSTNNRVIDFDTTRRQTLLGVNAILANPNIASFPSDPISLRSVEVINETVSNRENSFSTFEGLFLTLKHSNIIQLNSCILEKSDGTEVVYDIPQYGYSVLNNRYDTGNAFKLLTLNSNQIKLSDTAVLNNDFDVPSGDDKLIVSYLYIDNGINVDPTTITVSQIESAVREPIGAFLNIFYLKHFPIVNNFGAIITSGGVKFLDPTPVSGAPFTTTHPAFTFELDFDINHLPANPGEYSVNYTTGQVFVYGASTSDGTGSKPPVATYTYLKIFIDNIDYTFNPDSDELAANSTRDLIGQIASVEYKYEKVLAEGADFIKEDHIEVIDENVENRLVGTFRIAPKHIPVTNVFKISNETTGELYNPTGFTDAVIYFSGRNAPRVSTQNNEPVNFSKIFNDPLLVSDVIRSNTVIQIVKISLRHDNLISGSNDSIGSNINSHISFSIPELFVREFFYDNVLKTVSENISKLSTIGDYLIDYTDGVIYLYASLNTLDFGEISYTYGTIDPQHKNVISSNSVSYKLTNNSNTIVSLETPTSTTDSISVRGIKTAPERFLLDDTNKPIILGARQYGVLGQRTLHSHIFVALDAQFKASDADGSRFIRFDDSEDRLITAFISTNAVEVDIPFTDNDKNVSWCMIDFNFADGYTAITSYDIQNIRSVYAVNDLQNNDSKSLTNLFNPLLDSFSANVITFNNNLIKALPPGTALAIDYDFANLYVDYTYVADNVKISYEYGDNSINFSQSSALEQGSQYFVSYSYGALREGLVANFGSLTKIPELSDFPLNFDRELYRGGVEGALQAFAHGPTVNAIETIASSITDVVPTITELTFNEWTASRDNLYLDNGVLNGKEKYGDGKYGFGIIIDDDTTLQFPAEAYLSLREGTIEAWVVPNWRGLDNDASITFDIGQNGVRADGYDGYGITDGYNIALEDIYIGATAFNPASVPFTLNRADVPPHSPIGRPHNFGFAPGYFIWYDDAINNWIVRTVADPIKPVNFTGTITTSGQFYNVLDGYETNSAIFINEGLDSITSTEDYIKFSLQIDGYESSSKDGYVGFDGYDGYSYISPSTDGYLYQDGINFIANKIHYLFDTGHSLNRNRMSIFKDGSGYLNFQIYDANTSGVLYAISHNIQKWAAQEKHHVASSWRFNSAEGIDEAHLFIDGQEVSNLFKYGGRPEAATSSIYRTVANEVIIESATKNTVGGNDGKSVSGSNRFIAPSGLFVINNIVVGDTFTVLDATADSMISRTVTAVIDDQTIQLSSPMLLTVDNINYSVNRRTITTSTLLDVEKFAIFAINSNGVVRELAGLLADSPDYSISKSGTSDLLHINKNIHIGDHVYINTLGLTRGRVRDTVYKYDTSDTLHTQLPAPFTLGDVQIFKVIGKNASIINNGDFNPGDGYGDGYWSVSGSHINGTFTNLSQPSNTVIGKTLNIILGGTTNINFSGTNTVTINGSTSGGPATETITFTTYGTKTTTKLWTALTSIVCTFTGVNTSISFGSLEIIEAQPLTASEANGNYATIAYYANGDFNLDVFGSGGSPFSLYPAYYLVDYPIKLNIRVTQKGKLNIGSDISGANQWDGVIDEFIILNEMLGDVRSGESIANVSRSITGDYNSLVALAPTPQTTMMLHFDGSTDNADVYYKTFDEDIDTTSSSVNENFGDAAVFFNGAGQVIPDGSMVLNNNTGTIEFWTSPMIDTLNDMDVARYYIDIHAASNEIVLSSSFTKVQIVHRASKILSVKLALNNGNDIDYFKGGNLELDGHTINLGTKLPHANVNVVVQYVSIDNAGDRLSIYKDGYGSMNFEILASNKVFQISYPIIWKRNTWHRIVATWSLNNINNQDRIRLFVDGVEGGSILYGTPGLLYGVGTLYGSAAVGSLSANFLTTNIDFTDSFDVIHVGNSFDGAHICKARIDNLRFSNIVRSPAVVADTPIDINFNSNLAVVLPVIADNYTTAIFDYDRDAEKTEFLSNLLGETTPMFLFDVDVVDSFRKIEGNSRAQQLIKDIIDRVKPAHTQSFVKFLE